MMKLSRIMSQVDPIYTIYPHQQGEGLPVISTLSSLVLFTSYCPFLCGDILRTDTYYYVRVLFIVRVLDLFDDHYELHVIPVVDSGMPIRGIRALTLALSSSL